MKKGITIDLNIINSQDSKDLAANLLRGILEIRRDVIDEEYSSYIIETIDQLLIDNNFKILTTSDINTKLAKNIDELGLSARSLNCLRSEGLNYISDVVRKNPSDLLKISYFGRKSLNELEGKLRKIGLNLSSNFRDV
jgi:DNA-directed RNA polymerase alpha subunit